MNNGKVVISIRASSIEEMLEKESLALSLSDLVELRLDCVEAQTIDLDRVALDRNVILTYRPREQGGSREIDVRKRREFWTSVDASCGVDAEEDVVDLVLDRNFSPVIVSYHDFSGTVLDVTAIYERLAATEADVVKIATAVRETVDAIPLWRLLERARVENKELIPIAMGEAGKWTRILGLAHGAFLTYASFDRESGTAPGQISVDDLLNVYRVKHLDERTEVYGIIAGDTAYSMSPYLHNAAFGARGLNAVFVPLQVNELDAFMRRVVLPATREIDLNFRGFAVTNPHKRSILKYLDIADETVRQTGAVNTIAIVNGRLHGYNTDADGFLTALNNKWDVDLLHDTRVAVVGAGGAARACAFALKGSELTIVARDPAHAQELADLFDARKEVLSGKEPFDLSSFDIVVNATPLGTRGELVNEAIATADQLRGVKLVFDLVYNPPETRLLQEARRAGADTLNGFDMLVGQAAEQFKIWTGQTAPVDVMAEAARKKLDDH